MLTFSCPDQLARERIIAQHVLPVALDLRILDLDLLVRDLAGKRTANFDSLVEASCELYFKDQTLRFSRIGDIELAWGAVPRVSAVLTFASRGVTVAFELVLDSEAASVELQYVEFPSTLTTRQETLLLQRLLKRARRRCTARHLPAITQQAATKSRFWSQADASVGDHSRMMIRLEHGHDRP